MATDPAERERLLEERDHLLASIEDLDAERAAGDLDDEEHAALRDEYVARAAAVVRTLEAGPAAPLPAEPPKRSIVRRGATIAFVALVAVVAGWMLARSVGARGPTTGLTGSAASARQRLAECQPLAARDARRGIRCYDKILRGSPGNVEARTYRAWAQVRAGDVEEGTAALRAVAADDPAYPDPRVFLAVAAKNAGDFRAAQAQIDAVYRLDPPAGLLSTMRQLGLEEEVAFGLLPPDVAACWEKARAAAEALSRGEGQREATAGLAGALRCLADVNAARPEDTDALLARGYLLAISGAPPLQAQARTVLDRAVELRPQDPTARLVRAAQANSTGNPSAALADLDVLDSLPGRPSPLYPVAPAEQIRADVQRQLRR